MYSIYLCPLLLQSITVCKYDAFAGAASSIERCACGKPGMVSGCCCCCDLLSSSTQQACALSIPSTVQQRAFAVCASVFANLVMVLVVLCGTLADMLRDFTLHTYVYTYHLYRVLTVLVC